MSVIVEGESPTSVVIDQSLEKPGLPYRLTFNASKHADLLLDNGVTEEQMGQYTIHFRRGVRHPLQVLIHSSLARHNPRGKSITVDTDVLYYLNKIRGWDYLNDKANKVLLHESKHLIDWQFPKRVTIFKISSSGTIVGYNALAGLTEFILFHKYSGNFEIGNSLYAVVDGAVVGLGLSCFAFAMAYISSISEISARRFANSKNKDPRWQGILTFNPSLSGS